jgi:hypothetical protein
MQDHTERSRAELRAQAESLHINKTLHILLAMSSGSDDTAKTWRSLSIETYPRNGLSNLDDPSAEAKMSAWVAGVSNAPKPRSVVLSGQIFAVYVVGETEGAMIRKGAVIWTTIRKGKLLSFAFVANSPEQLTSLTESMKSVRFF